MKNALTAFKKQIVYFLCFLFIGPSVTFAQSLTYFSFDSPFALDSSCNSNDRKTLSDIFFKENDRKFLDFFREMTQEFPDGLSIRAQYKAYLDFSRYRSKIKITVACVDNLENASALAVSYNNKIRLLRSDAFTHAILFHEMYHFLTGSHSEGYIDFTVLCTASAFRYDNYFGLYRPNYQELNKIKKWCATGGTFELLNDSSYYLFVSKIGGELNNNFHRTLRNYCLINSLDPRSEEARLARDVKDFSTAILQNSNFYTYITEKLRGSAESKDKFIKTFIIPNLDSLYSRFTYSTYGKKSDFFHFVLEPIARAQIRESDLKVIVLKFLQLSSSEFSLYWRLSMPVTYIILRDPDQSYQVVIPTSAGPRVLGTLDSKTQEIDIPKNILSLRINILDPAQKNQPVVLQGFDLNKNELQKI